MSEFATHVGKIRDVIYREHAKMVIELERDYSANSVIGNCIATWGHNTAEMGGALVLLIIADHGKVIGYEALEVLRRASDSLLKMAEELMMLVRGEPTLPMALITNNACKEQALGLVEKFEKFVQERTLDS